MLENNNDNETAQFMPMGISILLEGRSGIQRLLNEQSSFGYYQ